LAAARAENAQQFYIISYFSFLSPPSAPLLEQRNSMYRHIPGLFRECDGTDYTIRSYYGKNLNNIPDAAMPLVCADK
jgi:hypothetical protein